MPRLNVRVISAKNLDLVSEKAYQEPWIIVKLGRLTSTIKSSPEKSLVTKNANPTFNQLLEMEFDDVQSARLEVEVHDVDEKNIEHTIGLLKLKLQNLAKKTASTWSYKLTSPTNQHSKAELELLLEAQDFDTTDVSFPATSSSAPAHGASSAPLNGSGGSSSMGGGGSIALNASGNMAAPSSSSSAAVPLPSHSPANTPHQQPSRAAVSSYPAPVQYAAKDIRRLHPHIAKGSYGVVYKGYVPDIEQVVVIKDMDFTNQKALDDWRKEIKMMAKTSCEFVVRVIGYATAERTLTIIMELMTNGSLYDVLHTKKETLSVITRMRMARHCALGLQHLHDLKVMHRDIKSMNILVTESYSCKLTDFGCAKSLNEQGAILNTANSGTPLWMAPEVKLGHYDYSADIYSLGLVIYELLENKLPQYDQIRGTVVIPREYDSKDIVGPCLSPDPRQRPKASEVVYKLDCVIRNIIKSVRSSLKESELKELGLSADATDDKLDSELTALYQVLLKKDPKAVDAMVYHAFGSSPEKASANRKDVPIQQAPTQFGMPQMAGYPPGMFQPMGFPPAVQMAPFPGMAPGAFGQPAYGTPPPAGFGYPPGY